MDSLSRFALQIAFRSCPCNESKKDCSGEHGKVESIIFCPIRFVFLYSLMQTEQPKIPFLSADMIAAENYAFSFSLSLQIIILDFF
ncbi:hypothetical protein C3V36_03465 [Lachnospiraceae bacterium oral taxon 500]|nr:hypothetical protein C3V36_03465 [Lachnospiraceae bacterium oral taxon 500]